MDQWEYRFALVVAYRSGCAYLVLGGEPETGNDRIVPFNRVEDEGWNIAAQFDDADLYDTAGRLLHGYSPVLLLKRRKP